MTVAEKADDISPRRPAHQVARLALLGTTWVCLVAGIFFSSMASSDATIFKTGMFLNTTGGANTGNYLEISPPSWAFAIWGFIYIFQVIWLVYATSTVFRRCGDTYLFYEPNYLPPVLYVVYCVNMALNTAWVFVWDRRHVLPALAILALLTATLYILLVVSIYALFKNQAALVAGGRGREYRYVIGMVHNAWGMYAAWCTIATLLNMCNGVTYATPVMSQEVSSALALGILAVEIMVYMLIDLGLWERYTRFLWTPYFVLFWALGSSLTKNFNSTKPTSIMLLTLFIAVVFFAILKLILVIYREKRDPAFTQTSSKVEPLSEKGTLA